MLHRHQEDTPCQGSNQNKGPGGGNVLEQFRHHREACVSGWGDKRQREEDKEYRLIQGKACPPLEDFYSEGDFSPRSREGTSSGLQGSSGPGCKLETGQEISRWLRCEGRKRLDSGQ